MLFQEVITVLLAIISYSENHKIILDNEFEVDLNEINHELDKSDGEARVSNWFFIYPGTKWCGAGDIAENDEDLGTARNTDKCCRAHDKCSDIIEGHGVKYGLENPSFYTKLNCDCDDSFYKCLKSVNTKTSAQVGHIYFTGLGTQCFKEEYPIAGCNKYTSFPHKKCLEYIFNRGMDKRYQWFDVPNF
ncbi:phospholipase A2-like [Euwallacea similis]|uniref:phospholipase A2-like n=1 Tax=Euwallacea similis TaxID=1736056 RepID=UPI00345053D7